MRAKRGGRDDGAKQRRASRARAGRGGAGRAAGAAGELTRRLRVAVERGPGGRSEHMGVAPRQSAPTRALRPAARCSGGSTRIYAPPPKRAITLARKGEKGEAERGPGPRGPGPGGARAACAPAPGRPPRAPPVGGRARAHPPPPAPPARRPWHRIWLAGPCVAGAGFGFGARAPTASGSARAPALRGAQWVGAAAAAPQVTETPEKQDLRRRGGLPSARADVRAPRPGGPIRDRAGRGRRAPKGKSKSLEGGAREKRGARPMGEVRRA